MEIASIASMVNLTVCQYYVDLRNAQQALRRRGGAVTWCHGRLILLDTRRCDLWRWACALANEPAVV